MKYKKLIYLLVLLLIGAPIFIFGIGKFLKPAVTATLKAEPTSIVPLSKDEKVVKEKTLQEGKLGVVTLNYKNNTKDVVKNVAIHMYAKGMEFFMPMALYSRPQSPSSLRKRNGEIYLLPSDMVKFEMYDPIYTLPYESRETKFFVYARQSGKFTLQAEVHTDKGNKIKTNPVTITVK